MLEDYHGRQQSGIEAEHLLSNDDRMDMANLSPQVTQDKNLSAVSTTYSDQPTNAQASTLRAPTSDGEDIALTEGGRHVEYKTYKIRWFGLTQLILMNIIVSWDVSFYYP